MPYRILVVVAVLCGGHGVDAQTPAVITGTTTVTPVAPAPAAAIVLAPPYVAAAPGAPNSSVLVVQGVWTVVFVNKMAVTITSSTTHPAVQGNTVTTVTAEGSEQNVAQGWAKADKAITEHFLLCLRALEKMDLPPPHAPVTPCPPGSVPVAFDVTWDAHCRQFTTYLPGHGYRTFVVPLAHRARYAARPRTLIGCVFTQPGGCLSFYDCASGLVFSDP